MWRFLVCVLGAGALSACSFDFKGFANGEVGGSGGAGATTGGVGPTTSATQSTGASSTTSTAATSGAVTSSVSTAAATSASSSSSSGAGGGSPLGPCGGITDDFANFPSAQWTVQGAATGVGGMAKLSIMPAQTWAGVWQHSTGIDECALTIELGSPPSSGTMYLKIDVEPNEATISYDDSSAHMLSVPGGQNQNLNAKPDALGFALTGGNIYYLYRSAGAWTVVSSAPRPPWMDGQDAMGFGVASGSNGKNGTFDNFSLTPVYKADLGL